MGIADCCAGFAFVVEPLFDTSRRLGETATIEM
jgi:hypothetical protein